MPQTLRIPLLFCIGIMVMISPANAAEPRVIVLFGDSLIVGRNVIVQGTISSMLQQFLVAKGHPVEIINASVMNDTTAGGYGRLEKNLKKYKTDLLILELGTYDRKLGLQPQDTQNYLEAMLTGLKAMGIPVLLVAMRADPEADDAYRQAFERIYPELAKRHQVPLYPYLLDGIKDNPKLMVKNRNFPNARGNEVIAVALAKYIDEKYYPKVVKRYDYKH